MSALGKVFGDPSIGPGEKLWAVVNNMIPVLGVFLLGWDAGPVLLLLWLDGWLGLWEIAAVAAVESSREKDPALAHLKGLKRLSVWLFAFLFVGALLSIPSIMAWVAIGTMIRDHYDNGLFSVLASGPSIWWAVGANTAFRAVQTALSLRRRGGERMAFTLEEKFHLLIFKAIGMVVLAQWLGSVGTTGLTVYVVLVSTLFAWMELNPGRFLHLLKTGRGAKESDPTGKRGIRKHRGAYPPSGDDEGRGPGPVA